MRWQADLRLPSQPQVIATLARWPVLIVGLLLGDKGMCAKCEELAQGWERNGQDSNRVTDWVAIRSNVVIVTPPGELPREHSAVIISLGLYIYININNNNNYNNVYAARKGGRLVWQSDRGCRSNVHYRTVFIPGIFFGEGDSPQKNLNFSPNCVL